MKLYVKLFYVLLFIFIVGIVLISCDKIDDSSPIIRIATGLVTASFVAGVNAFVNYKHQRKQFFNDLIDLLSDVENTLYSDFLDARFFCDFLIPSSNEKLGESIQGLFRSKAQEYSNKMVQYQHLFERSQARGFTELFPTGTGKKLDEWQSDLNEEFEKDLLWIPDMHMFHSYRTFPWEESDFNGTISDEFLDDFRSKCKRYRGRLAYAILFFANISSSAFGLLKGEVSKNRYDVFESFIKFMRYIVKDESFYDYHGFPMSFDEVCDGFDFADDEIEPQKEECTGSPTITIGMMRRLWSQVEN